MFVGLDIGTSGVKAVLVGDDQAILAESTTPLTLQRPHPLWSEQNPEDWWTATKQALLQLRQQNETAYRAVEAIGLSGQMHGATLLGASHNVLRPAILWNDGRSGEECTQLMELEPRTPEITGNIAMPGFTAPKLLWVAKHEPRIFDKIAKIVLPKDYIRLRLTGETVSDMSDSAGTLWLDVAQRDWSDAMLSACQLSREHMPRLIEGSDSSGSLTSSIAADLGLNSSVIVAGGAGDNAAGAIGIGALQAGQAFVSLGTSGVYFLSTKDYRPNPHKGLHTFCHCIPDTWHQMSVILSAASCLSWIVKATGAKDESSLLAEAETVSGSETVFLPYLSGERTPHNDPLAKGVFFGLSHATDRSALTRAVLEGVAFAFADGQEALLATGAEIDSVSVIGGGARSLLWGRILASVLDRPLTYHEDGEVGPAYGAARLARLALTNEAPADICTPPPISQIIEPDTDVRADLQPRQAQFKRLYGLLKSEFHKTGRNK